MYDKLDDAIFRLQGTFVQYDGKYRFVSSLKNHAERGILLYLSGMDKPVPINDEKLNFLRPKVGYVKALGRLMYLSRMPNRTYRQGLRHDNVRVSGGTLEHLMHHQEEDELMEREDEGEVLSQDFAIVDNKLFYKEREVGIRLNGNCHLSNDYQFLKEALEEVTNV